MTAPALSAEFPLGKKCPLCRGGLNEFGHTPPCWRVQKELRALRDVVEAARSFFSQPYDNGQWETRLRDAVLRVGT